MIQSSPMIEIAGIAKRYSSRSGEEIEALAPITVAVKEKEFLTIVGPSGCGKSTLLKILAGTVRRTAGTIRLQGSPLEGPNRHIGMVFQAPVLLPWRTVEENALLPIELQRGDVEQNRKRVAELFDLVGLSGFEKRYPNELSGGMQQRVGIVRALIHDPNVLLLDEPFGALDAMTREHMNLELVRICHMTGKTVVLVTHSIPEAIFLADRVVVMSPRPGRVVDIVDIDLPRPRHLDVTNLPNFGTYVSQIRGMIGARGGFDS
jgi:NitT/TauT family transport system ATP-binding protein